MPYSAGLLAPKHAALKGHSSTTALGHRAHPKSTGARSISLHIISPLQETPSGQASQLHSDFFFRSSRYWLTVQSAAVIHRGFSHAVAWAFGILPPVQLKHEVAPRTSEYSPVGHKIQLEFLPYFPKSHRVHSEAPDALYVPPRHAEHVVLLSSVWSASERLHPTGQDVQPLPGPIPYWPGAQSLHATLPFLSEYVPATQSVQLDAFSCANVLTEQSKQNV